MLLPNKGPNADTNHIANSLSPLRPETGTTQIQPFSPPPGVNYDENPSVFGKILRGEIPTDVLEESDHLLSFRDIRPWAPLHALVIPKQFVESVYDLDDLELLYGMREMAERVMQQHQPQAYEDQDYLLCFHIPPFTSVNHLHLHVLSPKSKIPWLGRRKYLEGSRWCISEEHVRARLEVGKSPVPYARWNPAISLRVAIFTILVLGSSFWIIH